MTATNPIRTLIVDDEALSRRGLEIRLRTAGDFEIVGECANGREAIEAVRERQPDLVFLDIQMPGLSGFDVLAQLPADSLPMVVFVTAYDTYAIRAFEARAVDYLLKPVDESRFAAAVEHIRELRQQRSAALQRNRLVELLADVSGSGEIDADDLLARGSAALPPARSHVLPIREGRETIRLDTATIDWIDAAGDYMCIHAGSRTHILRGTMKELEDALDPKVFQRVHRSTIVNLARVKTLRSHMNGEYFLTLDGGHELKLSRTYRDKVEYFLKGPRLN
ncbi:MAG: Transcriptional regulatory protein BtsR [Steroidobacteraceae bacterium]|nr:Transcriptional regulatory protein BtsR [Steroidobacteraceae bacterium]